jgi:hypothetical protein
LSKEKGETVSAPVRKPSPRREDSRQPSLFAQTIVERDPIADSLKKAVSDLDVDALSPREALAHLYELKAKTVGTVPSR